MGWIQKTQPNLDDKTLVATDGAGNVLKDWYCWCLAVTQASFGIKEAKYASADQCWNNNQNRHIDNEFGLNIPIGKYVPVFFTGGQYGHVVVAFRESYEKIKIWSSPYTHKPYFDYFYGDTQSTIKKVASIYGVKYVGWTETLTGKRIVEWVEDALKPTLEFKSYEKSIKYKAKLQPTHLWDVSNATTIDAVKDLKTINAGTEFWVYGDVFNKQLGGRYLLDKECTEKKIAKGYNIVDMEMVVENLVENTEPPEKPVVEKSDETVETNNLVIKIINRLINWLKSLIS